MQRVPVGREPTFKEVPRSNAFVPNPRVALTGLVFFHPLVPECRGETRGSACVAPMAASRPSSAARAPSCPESPDEEPEYRKVFIVFHGAPGAPRIEAQHAETIEAKRRGLMYRTSLPEDAGMLFTWTHARPRSFWMKDTCIPLDLVFLGSDATIVGVVENAPAMSRELLGVPCPSQRVLEVNAGWVRAHGVMPGQRVEILGG